MIISRVFSRKRTLIRASLEGLAITYIFYFIANAPSAIHSYLEMLPNASMRDLIFSLELVFSFGKASFNNPALNILFHCSLSLAFFLYVKLTTHDVTFKQGLKAALLLFLAKLISIEVAPPVGIGVLWSSPLSESLSSILEWAIIIIPPNLVVDFLIINYISTLVLAHMRKRTQPIA